uniref:Uncharacterized protein n=1 Tax=Oryctolagus cuniculus TaxID=9986 RepID=G1TJS7_RABIT
GSPRPPGPLGAGAHGSAAARALARTMRPAPLLPLLPLLLLALLAAPAAGARTAESAPPPAPRPGNDTRAGGFNGTGDALMTRVSTLLRDLPALKAAVIVACALSALLVACLLLRVLRWVPRAPLASRAAPPGPGAGRRHEGLSQSAPGRSDLVLRSLFRSCIGCPSPSPPAAFLSLQFLMQGPG